MARHMQPGPACMRFGKILAITLRLFCCRRRVKTDPQAAVEPGPPSMIGRVLSVEDWAEIRRLHRAEGMPIKAIVRKLGVGRNTVRRALAADTPPAYSRPAKPSIVDPFEPQIRGLLAEWPSMPTTV